MNELLHNVAGPGSRAKTMPVAATLLIAVAIAVLVALQYRHSQAIVFKETTIITAKYRGPDGEVQPATYTEEQLALFAAALQEGVLTAYLDAVPPVKKGLLGGVKQEWILGSSLQELFDGAVGVEVKAFSFEDEAMVKAWSHEYGTAAEFEAGVAELAARISADLASLRQATVP